MEVPQITVVGCAPSLARGIFMNAKQLLFPLSLGLAASVIGTIAEAQPAPAPTALLLATD